MTDEQLRAIYERAAASHPGELVDMGMANVWDDDGWRADFRYEKDAPLFVHAREDVLALIEEIFRLKTETEAYRSKVARHERMIGDLQQWIKQSLEARQQ
jgi:hypothetical protein